MFGTVNLLVLTLFIVNFASDCSSVVIFKDPNSCGREKCVEPIERKFKYEEGSNYHYRYRTDVLAHFSDHQAATLNDTRLLIDADVYLHFSSACEGHLIIKNVVVNNQSQAEIHKDVEDDEDDVDNDEDDVENDDEDEIHNRKKAHGNNDDEENYNYKAILERFLLRFTFHDGQIKEICPVVNEEIWALNFKRGILSMLQNTMIRFDVDRRIDEVDVNGICEARYKLHEAKKTSLIVKKTKNLASCTHRSKHYSAIQSTAFRSPMSPANVFRQSLLTSRSNCEIIIDHSIYENVTCHDVYRFQPLSNDKESDPTILVTTTLTLQTEDAKNPDENNESSASEYFTRTTLLYDHSRTPRMILGKYNDSRDTLKEICELGTSDELQEEFSQLFTSLIQSTRTLDYPALSRLIANAETICPEGRKILLNALPFIGSNAGISIMKDLIIEKSISRETAENWITSFAFISHPNDETIRSLEPLLDLEDVGLQAPFILSYSSIIHAYCVLKDRDCSDFEPITSFVEHVKTKIKSGCAPRMQSRDQIEQTLRVLKAVGNVGVEVDSLVDEIRTCIDDSSGFIPMEVRVAAIDAHRRLPSCHKIRDEYFLSRYRNFTIDTEIRIASYLQVMRCPDHDVMKIIKQTLKEEEVNQVGSYVWSHLSNIISSSSPTHLEIQSLLTDQDIEKKFKSDFRKFSRNYESSFFSEEYSVGMNYQGNVIFSPDSYIPRTGSFNYTLEIFGESINLFEITVRVDGMEYYTEKLFGFDAPFNSDKVFGGLRQLVRNLRSVKTETEDYYSHVGRLPTVIKSNFNNPRISIGYKIFGNELSFKMLEGEEEIRKSIEDLNPWNKIRHILSGQEVLKYDNTVMFLDMSYIVPSSAGLPIRLNVAGSAACNIKLSGIMNSMKFSSNGELELNGNITPSVSVDLSGTMMLDSFYKSVGLMARTSVYSSGAVQANLTIKGMHLVRLGLNLPSKSLEILSVKTDVMLISTNASDSRMKATSISAAKNASLISRPLISNTTCSWSALDHLLGLKLCMYYRIPNITNDLKFSHFIIMGPTTFKLSLIKADPTANSYVFEYKWNRTITESVIKLSFDTPGSKMHRELSAMLAFNARNNNVTLLLKSAGNRLVAQGTYKKTDNKTFIDVGLDINGTKHLDASIGYSRKKANYGYMYMPKLFIAINGEPIAQLSGTIRNQRKHEVSQCDIDIIFQTKKVWSQVLGYVIKRNVSMTSNFKIDYQLQRTPKRRTLQVEFAVSDRSTRTLTHKTANLKVHSTAYPQLNIVVGSWYQQSHGHFEAHAQINRNPSLKDDRYILTTELVITYSPVYFQSDGTSFNAFFAMTKPIQNFDIKVGVNHYSISAESKTNFLIRYAPKKEITCSIHTITPRGPLLAVEVHGNLTITNFNSMLVNVKITQRTKMEYDLYFDGTWFSGHNMTARGTYMDRSTQAITNHNLKLMLNSPHFAKEMLLLCKFFQDVTDIQLGLQLEQFEMDKYSFVINHSSPTLRKFATFVEGRYKNKLYSVTTNLDFDREIRIELHLDHWRDVHLIGTAINEINNKEYGVELKWDANRNPASKLACYVRVNKLVTFNEGNSLTVFATANYPGISIAGSSLFALRKPNNYLVDALLQWGIGKTIKFSFNTDYDLRDWLRTFKIESELLTPFENWKKTSLGALFNRTDSNLTARVGIQWDDTQHLMANFTVNSDINDRVLEWDALCQFASTIHYIQWVSVNFTHKQLFAKSIDSRLMINYHPDKVIYAKNAWYLENGENNAFNLTGNIQLMSPVGSYRNAEFNCQLYSKETRQFFGAANINFDSQNYSAYLTGDLRKFKESMVKFKLTTPFDKYGYLHGRFGVSESNRHFVALIVSPGGSLGVEGICKFFGKFDDFNVQLTLATPIDGFYKSSLVAKRSKGEIDFHATYNNLTAGFRGYWMYTNITKFSYNCTLFTPFHGYQEINTIAKLVLIRSAQEKFSDIDAELYFKLFHTQAGVIVKAGPRPLPAENMLGRKQRYNFHWQGEINVYPGITDTISALLDVYAGGSSHKIVGILKLPNDYFVIDDCDNVNEYNESINDINGTLFACPFKIISMYDLNEHTKTSVFITKFNVNVKNRLMLLKGFLNMNYKHEQGDSENAESHVLQFDVNSPTHSIEYIKSKYSVDVNSNEYKVNFSMATKNCDANLYSTVELTDKSWDSTIELNVDSPIIRAMKTTVKAKKNFSTGEKLFDVGIDFLDSALQQNMLKAYCHSDGRKFLNMYLILDTTLEGVSNFEAGILYNNSLSFDKSIIINSYFNHELNEDYTFSSSLRNDKLKARVKTPFSRGNLEFAGDIVKVNESHYRITGDLKETGISEPYKVICPLEFVNEELHSLDLQVSQKSNEIARIKLKKKNQELISTVESKQLNGEFFIDYNQLGWDMRTKFESDKLNEHTAIAIDILRRNDSVTLDTRIEKRLNNIKDFSLSGKVSLNNADGDIDVICNRDDDSKNVKIRWKLKHLQNISVNVLADHRKKGVKVKAINVSSYLDNRNNSFKDIDVGFNVNINDDWKFASNSLLVLKDHNNIDVTHVIKGMTGKRDHKISFCYHVSDKSTELQYVVGSKGLRANVDYAFDKMLTGNIINGYLILTWGNQSSQSLTNILNMTIGDSVSTKYALFTPLHLRQETVLFDFKYRSDDRLKNHINVSLNYPASKRIASAKISYTDLHNFVSNINASTHMPYMSEVECDVIVETNNFDSRRFIKLVWPNNSFLTSDYVYKSKAVESNLNGRIHFQFPLSTRHAGDLIYNCSILPQETKSYSILSYNDQKILEGQYNSSSQIRPGNEKDHIQLLVDNIYKPFGMVYVNEYRYSTENEGTNYPTEKHRQFNVFGLKNNSNFRIHGEINTRTTEIGEEVEIKTVHANRSVKFRSGYDMIPGDYKHHAWISVADNVWAGYHIRLVNKTTKDVENQSLVVDLTYPKRNVTVDCTYRVTDAEFNSEADVKWNSDEGTRRQIGTSFQWKTAVLPNKIAEKSVTVGFRHPSFENNMTCTAQLFTNDDKDLLKVNVTINYSDDKDRLLVLTAKLRDDSQPGVENKYTYIITGSHPKSEFSMNVEGYVRKYLTILFETKNDAYYKRSFLPEDIAKLHAHVNFKNKEIFFDSESRDMTKYLKVRYYPTYPTYVINGSVINGNELNATGEYIMDPEQKYVRMIVNFTPDAVESLRMFGNIPNARKGEFRIWRTYDQDFSISDVSLYVRLNHSRLVTSTLRWRPELQSDVRNVIINAITNLYESVSSNLEYWNQYVKTEGLNTITDVWTDAEEEFEEFMEDYGNIKIIVQDFEELQTFLNNSYYANDFYIRDIVAMGFYLVDEISFRNYIKSMPNIINEIWEIMGESGEMVRKSIIWVIEGVVKGYHKFVEFVNALLKGESWTQISATFHRIIEKYDLLIKDIHVSFIKYIENLCTKLKQTLSNHWHTFLKFIEPIFIRVLHYLETFLWNAGKSIVNFLYERQNELIASPYFDQFSNFTHDIDRVYRDIKSNDIITNVRKYTVITINFVKGRYFALVPFGKELWDIIDEIVSELKELRKLPSIQYAIEKINQLYDRANHVYRYLNVQAKLERTIKVIHMKLLDISQTALQADSRYRSAKTKFVFDPHTGLMCLEQKLPMSWYSFDQMPEFQEIPEYKMIADFGSFFVMSNVSFWSLYYKYKPYAEPSNWLPPFKAQALIAGSQHFVTFDGRHIEFAGSCTYVVARDFARNQFTVLIKYGRDNSTNLLTHTIIVLIENRSIELDITKNTVHLDSGSVPQLPVEFNNGTIFVYQDESIVTVERKPNQFKLTCNLKFDLCTLELSGWYHGTTAGLFGTMNHEVMDDTLTSNGTVINDIAEFAHTWALEPGKCSQENYAAIGNRDYSDGFCGQLFRNKTSEFNNCFNVVDPSKYYEMCLNGVERDNYCTVAMSFMRACMFHEIWLRIPAKCTVCILPDGSKVPEGEFRKVDGTRIPMSSDIVFIVEAKECNRGLGQNNTIDQLIIQLNKELNNLKITENRWSLVIFGGNGVYDKPRSLALNSQIFTKNVVRFGEYFRNIPIGNGSRDIFEAIGFASELVFRYGVSKTFILVPCSNCAPKDQKLDYSVLHEVLLERDITLHTLMDGEFHFDKGRLYKIFYGLDATKSYTKKDYRALAGDVEMRRQVKLPKSALGFCTPLSLETNGTIFSGHKFRRIDKVGARKKFINVFAKRIALSAHPNSCQVCECNANNDGITKMECMPCIYPSAVSVDFVSETFGLDNTILQSTDVDYSQAEED